MSVAPATGLPDILPTHSCFDDAVEFFYSANVAIEDVHRFKIVHGICRGHAQGTPYAHAWVEQNGSVVWQAGVQRETGEGIYFALPLLDFYRMYAVQETTPYSVGVVEGLLICGMSSGPWKPEYVALCNDTTEGRVLGSMSGVEPVAFLRRKSMPESER